MLFGLSEKTALDAFFKRLKLQNGNNKAGKDKAAKIGQILAYLEIIHAQLRQYSKKRELVCIESGAGNAYLSFLVYYFYTEIKRQPITVHCLDTNGALVDKARRRATELGFAGMRFHACDIAEFDLPGHVDLVYSLHACDTATDKTLHLGIRHKATCILSVACCQHTLRRRLKGQPCASMARHRVFKDRIVYMVGDTLRALLLEIHGYRADILEFVSSRHTDKNIMLRARKNHIRDSGQLWDEYTRMRDAFHVKPLLEEYLRQDPDTCHKAPNYDESKESDAYLR
jgi:hypothetical protein